MSRIADLRACAQLAANTLEACHMLDILFIALGAGGVMLMAAYAWACERI
jgi:hypothetical protein